MNVLITVTVYSHLCLQLACYFCVTGHSQSSIMMGPYRHARHKSAMHDELLDIELI